MKAKRNETTDYRTGRFGWLKYLILSVVMFISGGLSHATLMPLAQPTSENPDLFADYVGVMPGQPIGIADRLGFDCPAINRAEEPMPYTCVIEPLTGEFARIYIRVIDDTIKRITFLVDGDQLTIADLIALWGEPEVNEYSNSVYLRWRDQNFLAIAQSPDHAFSPELNVWRVHITG